MTTLIRYHEKNKAGSIYFRNNNFFRKYSNLKSYLPLIESEYKGQIWYSKRLKLPIPFPKGFVFKNKQTYIDILAVNGKKINFWDNLTKTNFYVNRVAKHYNEVWPKKKIVPCHGDLSLENIIFYKKKYPRIIDWEHFSFFGEEWGFDLAYFLVSAAVVPSMAKQLDTIPSIELILFENIWKNFLKINNIKSRINTKPFEINCFFSG